MSLDAEAEAFKTRLTTATQAPVYDLDEAKALTSLPPNHTLIYVARRFGGEARFSGTRDTNLRRLSTRVVAKTITNARLLEDRIVTEFEHSEVSYESGGGAYEFDDGYYTALTDWTYVA